MKRPYGEWIAASPETTWDRVVADWQGFPGMQAIDGPSGSAIRVGSEFAGHFNIFGQPVYGEGTMQKFEPSSLAVLRVVNIKPLRRLPLPTPNSIGIALALERSEDDGTQLDVEVDVSLSRRFGGDIALSPFVGLVDKMIRDCVGLVKSEIETPPVTGAPFRGVDLSRLRPAA
jgi:hypothetical protein